jgi:hypothetical protein
VGCYMFIGSTIGIARYKPKALFGCALVAVFWIGALTVHAQAKHQAFRHDRDVETAFLWEAVPRWDGERLLGYFSNHTNGPVIYTIDRDGRRDEMLFTFQDAGRIDLSGIAGSREGEIAVIGSAFTADSRGTSFLARISPDRKRQIVTRVWPYCPSVVTLASDGTLWTIGHLKDNENTRVLAWNVLRRFDRSGKLIGSTTLSVKRREPVETSHLRASLDRVGWFTLDNEYLEFSLDGSEIGRYDGPDGASQRDITGIALDDQNDVVVGWFGKGKTQFVVLDREARVWRPLQLPKEYAPTWAMPLGFDGTTLVTDSKNGTLRRFKPE